LSRPGIEALEAEEIRARKARFLTEIKDLDHVSKLSRARLDDHLREIRYWPRPSPI